MVWLGKKIEKIIKKLKNGPGYQKNKNENNKIKKKQAWYKNSKEQKEGYARQKFKKITSSQQVTEGRMGLEKKTQQNVPVKRSSPQVVLVEKQVS